MILKSHRWIRGSRHDVGEPPKRKGILTRCRTVAEKIGDPGMMPESRQNDRGSGHDAKDSLQNDRRSGHDVGELSK